MHFVTDLFLRAAACFLSLSLSLSLSLLYSINAQINMYVMSRVILGGVKALSVHGFLPSAESVPNIYTIYAAITWAIVMYMHQWQTMYLQKSLTVSMDYLYNESNKWPELPANVDAATVVDWFIA